MYMFGVFSCKFYIKLRFNDFSVVRSRLDFIPVNEWQENRSTEIDLNILLLGAILNKTFLTLIESCSFSFS